VYLLCSGGRICIIIDIVLFCNFDDSVFVDSVFVLRVNNVR